MRDGKKSTWASEPTRYVVLSHVAYLKELWGNKLSQLCGFKMADELMGKEVSYARTL
jgi:hypothetical protein